MHITQLDTRPEQYPVTDQYPFNLALFQKPLTLNFKTNVTFIMGENGSGKSTLLRAMAERAGIYIWQGIQRTRYDSNPYENQLHRYIDLTWVDGQVPGSYFGAQHFNNFSQLVDEWCALDNGVLDYFGGKSLVSQSHGQSIMSYFQARYGKKGVYFLDEPETALSPASQVKFIRLLDKINQGSGVQMIIATHSPLLPACPNADIFHVNNDGIHAINYDQCGHAKIYRDFLNDPAAFLEQAEI